MSKNRRIIVGCNPSKSRCDLDYDDGKMLKGSHCKWGDGSLKRRVSCKRGRRCRWWIKKGRWEEVTLCAWKLPSGFDSISSDLDSRQGTFLLSQYAHPYSNPLQLFKNVQRCWHQLLLYGFPFYWVVCFKSVPNVSFWLHFSCWWSWLTFQALDNEAVLKPYLEVSDQAAGSVWLGKVPLSCPSCDLALTHMGQLWQSKVRAVKVGCWKDIGEQVISLNSFLINSLNSSWFLWSQLSDFYAKSDSILLFKKEEEKTIQPL